MTEKLPTLMPTWCPSCGNFIIKKAFEDACDSLNIQDITVVSGIGCSSLFPQFIPFSGALTLHGRAIPFALGIALSNPQKKVVVLSGDGDTYGIGMGHFIHLFRRKVNMTVIVHNNSVYGLTKGQDSPTGGENPVKPLLLALSANASFVARGSVHNLPHLTEVIKQAIHFEGVSFVDILQTCPSFAKHQSMQFLQENTFLCEKPFSSREKAYEFLEKEEKMGLGVVFIGKNFF
jgi:2-oxoglutarate ferredoxin oxidoreductase subunit beta